MHEQRQLDQTGTAADAAQFLRKSLSDTELRHGERLAGPAARQLKFEKPPICPTCTREAESSKQNPATASDGLLNSTEPGSTRASIHHGDWCGSRDVRPRAGSAVKVRRQNDRPSRARRLWQALFSEPPRVLQLRPDNPWSAPFRQRRPVGPVRKHR